MGLVLYFLIANSFGYAILEWKRDNYKVIYSYLLCLLVLILTFFLKIWRTVAAPIESIFLKYYHSSVVTTFFVSRSSAKINSDDDSAASSKEFIVNDIIIEEDHLDDDEIDDESPESLCPPEP